MVALVWGPWILLMGIDCLRWQGLSGKGSGDQPEIVEVSPDALIHMRQ